MLYRKRQSTVLMCWLILMVGLCSANSTDLKIIELQSGSVLKGNIIEQNKNSLTIQTIDNLTINVDRENIVSIRSSEVSLSARSDPKSTRLLFSPTGRPLKKGSGYITDFYVFLPSVSYGVTDKFSVMGGMSLVPAISIGDQIKYIAPRYSFYESKNSASAVGFLNVFANSGDSAGIAYITHTVGKPSKSLTAGIGWGYVNESSSALDFYEYPVIMIGGNIHLTESMAFISENWLITGTNIKNYPFVAGLRFFSDKFAVDVGVMLIGEIIKEGIPIPWLSFSYHF